MRTLIIFALFSVVATQVFAVAKSSHDVARSSSEAAKNASEVSIRKGESRTFGDPLKAPGVHDVKQNVNDVTSGQDQRKAPAASSAPGAEDAVQTEVSSGESVGRDSHIAVERDKRRKQNWDEVDQQRRERAEEIEQEQREQK